MKIVFVSSFLNHHQYPLCKELISKAEEFWFVATERVANVGYQVARKEPFVLSYFEEAEQEKIREKILQADVVIFGACPIELIAMRMREDKLSFIYSERFFKKGTWRRFIPSVRNTIKQKIVNYKDRNLYILCASAFLSYDLSLLGYPFEKCLRWGYFPEVKHYQDMQSLIMQKKENSILWCGRLIPLKHPEYMITLAESLKKKKIPFEINIVGEGELKEKLQQAIDRKNLGDCVRLIGVKSQEEVRKYMEQSEIFLFTSNRMEGWGAVLNEAMNSGCAVVASHQIGSAPFLIEEDKNGLVYRQGDVKDLYEKVVGLLHHCEERRQMGMRAYQTLKKSWNAAVAAERVVRFSKHILQGKKDERLWENGPCSTAAIVKDDWYNKRG